ncbi:MAG: hypothetical protein IT372_10465 [Polyangiaceae bacterium]|nr:hypothetical protein [Polyangiaceae bacterium]
MSEPADTAPSLRYFRANEGRWRAPFVFTITDRAAFAQSPLGWLDRLRVRLMVLAPRLLGPLVMDTRMDATSRIAAGEVVHTTRVSKWGLPLYEATEVFALDPNGRDIAISRRERMWPSPFFTREEGRSRGAVEPSGQRARYLFPFFGAEIRQTGSIEDGGVRIVQETDFSRVELLLVRR